MIARFTAIIFIALLLFTGCGKKDETKQTNETQTQTVKEEKAAANVIHLKTTQDQVIKLTALENGILFDDYKGKVVLLSFFATWCPPCITEIPHLNAIQNDFKEKVQIVAILLEESKTNSEIEVFIQNHKINYPVTNCRDNFILSEALGGIRSLPTLVIYDKNGNYHEHFVGAVPQEMIEEEIRKALEK